MRYFDIFVSPKEEKLWEVVEAAEELGFSGICFAPKFSGLEDLERSRKLASEVASDFSAEIFTGTVVTARDARELGRTVRKVRKRVEVVLVLGGDYRINRAACTHRMVDVLLGPNSGPDPCMDLFCAKSAVRTGTVVAFEFRSVLKSYGTGRSDVLRAMRILASLSRETGFEVVTCSGARTRWELRDPRALVSLALVSGLDEKKAKASVSSVPAGIVERNRKRLSKNQMWDGVEVVE